MAEADLDEPTVPALLAIAELSEHSQSAMDVDVNATPKTNPRKKLRDSDEYGSILGAQSQRPCADEEGVSARFRRNAEGNKEGHTKRMPS